MECSRRSVPALREAVLAILATLLLAAPARGQCVPEIVGSVGTSSAVDVAVSGTHAYVADEETGLRVIDVSDPANPTIVSTIDVGDARGVAVEESRVYVAEGNALRVVDVSVPASPHVIAAVDVGFIAYDVAVSAGFAYVVGFSPFDVGRLIVIDVSDPQNPLLLGSFSSGGSAIYGDVAVADAVAYVTGATDHALVAFDVSDPMNPTVIAEFGEFGSEGVDVSGNLAYVAGLSTESRMWVIDVSDPKNPAIIGSVELPGWLAWDVAVAGGEAYVAGHDGGLQIVDVSVPSSPTILGHVATPTNARAVAVSGSVAYVGAGSSGLHVVDASTCDRGACCIAEGCLELTAATCASVSGTYLGDESTCANGVCPPPCRADLNDSGAVDFADILEVLRDWGPCP